MWDENTASAVIRASRPTFRNKHDAVAFAVHAAFHSAGFYLSATGPAALANDALTAPFSGEVTCENWNALDDHYAFVYADPKKGLKKVLLKCLVMNEKLLVDAVADGTSKPVHLEIDVDNFVGNYATGFYPSRYKNFTKLISSLDKEVISKLYGSTSKSNSSSNHPSIETGEPRSGGKDPGVSINEPTGPHLHPSGVVVPPIPSVGGSDLHPGPGAGIYPTRGDFGGGSMLLGPNDPRWLGGEPNFPGGQPGVPPGARFDPIGPPDVPGFEPFRFVRNPPRRPGSGANHPDLEHFRNGSDFI